MARIGVPLLLLASGLLWVTDQGTAQPAKIGIQGSITKVDVGTEDQKKAGTLGTILVEGPKSANPNSDKASVRITDKTKLEKSVGKNRKPATFDDLKVGTKVQVTFDGPVAESYPVQGKAGVVLIVTESK